MPVTAEVCNPTFEEIVSAETWQPLVIEAHETEYEQQLRFKAAQFIGSSALRSSVTTERIEAPHTYTLNEAIHKAAEGDKVAHQMVRANVATDVIERTVKSGHVISVDLEVDEKGAVWQHGQSASDIQMNSLVYGSQHPHMKRRTQAETRNMFRIEEANRRGLLEDYVFLVISRVPESMTEAELKEAGFFTDTMSLAIQATSSNGGKLQVESAFVAGKPTWDSPRQDKEAVSYVGDSLGVDLSGMDDVGLLDSPILVSKRLLPNGVVDFVEIFDKKGGTFFGEDKPRQDYLSYTQKCKERESELGSRIDSITERLISEAFNFTTPQEASQRLNKLSGEEMIEQSITDNSIDPRVFGTEAAYRIEHARYLVQSGQHENAREIIRQAKLLDNSSSCPGGAGKLIGEMEDADQTEGGSSSELKDCEFVSKECPKCHKKNVKTVVKKGRYYGACGCHS